MSDEHKTSFAKDVHFDTYTQNVLDRQEAIKARYNSASQGQSQSNGQSQAVQGQGSAQVKNSQPGMHHEPRGPMRDAVKAQTHQADMAKDDKAAKDRAAKYLDRMKSAENRLSSDFNVQSNHGHSRN